MNQKITTIEELLGVPKGYKRPIPGTFDSNKNHYIYIEDDGSGKDFKKQFRLITQTVQIRHPTSGTLFEQGCKIELPKPDSTIFHAISYSGDFAGWRMDIEEDANNRNLKLSWIEGDKFVISDGRSYVLSDCKVEFY